MADVQVKLEQEEMDQTEQEKMMMNNTEHDNASAAPDQVAILNNAEVGGQNNDNIMNNNEGGHYDGDINGDMWELEDINEMDTALAAREFLGSYDDNVSGGGWGEWKYDGGETWREWEFAAANNYYQDNDWVIEDLWVFDDHHYPNYSNGANNNGAAAAANPRDPQA